MTPESAEAKQSLSDILARFDRYHPARIDLSLDRVERLLAALGAPQRKLPPVIHIAGTNGKGSTLAFLRAMCEAAGLAVSTYTSPHLVRFTERFVLGGTEIAETDLCTLLLQVEAVNAGQPITEFEIVTAAAFLALARAPADIVLLETGLGGRYDATNVVERPLATVITPISLDHQAFLGPDIATIAAEKAAIQKSGVPSIVAPQTAAAAQTITRIGRDIGATLFRAGVEWSFEPTPKGFDFRSARRTLSLPAPALAGSHQIVNAATAVACIEHCSPLDISETDIAKGLTAVRWPGRFERLADGPLRQRLPADWEVWLDAGHNTAAGAALAATLRQINTERPLPLHIVFGMVDDKDLVAFARPLAELAASVTTVPLPGEPRGIDPHVSAATLSRAGIEATAQPTLEAAFDALAASPARARVLLCGSHVLVGTALQTDARPL